MNAFVTGLPVASAACLAVSHSTCQRRPSAATVLTSRGAATRRAVWTMCDPAAAPEEVEKDLRPPEPYPGFYKDMQRAGLSEEQAVAQAAKVDARKNPSAAARLGGKKSLVGPDGKPLAPWMNISEDNNRRGVRGKSSARGRLAGDPQQQELNGQGLTFKMLGDEIELRWATGSEDGNQGFVVSRRRGKSEEWVVVSDYNDKPAELLSKGSSGGMYSFIVSDAEPGSWVYRVSDVDSSGKVSDLSQTLIEVESDDESQTRLVALAALLAVIVGMVVFSVTLDPLSGTS